MNTLFGRNKVDTKDVPQVPLEPVKIENYTHFVAKITRPMGNTRVVIKTMKVGTKVQFFRWGGGSYFVDFKNVFLVDELPILVYDVTIFESAEYTTRVVESGKEVSKQQTLDGVHLPIKVDSDFHYSADADMLLKQNIITQALIALQQKGVDVNWVMWLVFLAIGAVMGYFMGNVIPMIHQSVPVPVPTPTHVTTTVTSTSK